VQLRNVRICPAFLDLAGTRTYARRLLVGAVDKGPPNFVTDRPYKITHEGQVLDVRLFEVLFYPENPDHAPKREWHAGLCGTADDAEPTEVYHPDRTPTPEPVPVPPDSPRVIQALEAAFLSIRSEQLKASR